MYKRNYNTLVGGYVAIRETGVFSSLDKSLSLSDVLLHQKHFSHAFELENIYIPKWFFKSINKGEVYSSDAKDTCRQCGRQYFNITEHQRFSFLKRFFYDDDEKFLVKWAGDDDLLTCLNGTILISSSVMTDTGAISLAHCLLLLICTI